MLKTFCIIITVVFLLSCKTTTYYISRHAEKSGTNMTANPPLSAEGEKQALDLRAYLTGKGIKSIYSTNFIRTRSTAEPTSVAINVPIQVYTQVNDLVDTLKATGKGNVLIVGHSNTVDDIVNRFTGVGTMTDLADSEYGNLFIVKKKRSKYSFERIKLPSNRP
jgi:2,3-bisphosphoglycerate-dependent phosphoglycerate mutase